MRPQFHLDQWERESMSLHQLVPVDGGDPVPLLWDLILIGRRIDCHIVLRFPNVQPQHCVIAFENGRWYITALHESPVTVNDEVLISDEKHPISSGDRIGIDSLTFRYEGGDGPPTG